jgi:hypothetical protein
MPPLARRQRSAASDTYLPGVLRVGHACRTLRPPRSARAVVGMAARGTAVRGWLGLRSLRGSRDALAGHRPLPLHASVRTHQPELPLPCLVPRYGPSPRMAAELTMTGLPVQRLAASPHASMRRPATEPQHQHHAVRVWLLHWRAVADARRRGMGRRVQATLRLLPHNVPSTGYRVLCQATSSDRANPPIRDTPPVRVNPCRQAQTFAARAQRAVALTSLTALGSTVPLWAP